MGESALVEIQDNPQQSRYEARAGGELAAFTRYELHNRTITFTHTETLPAFAGQGMGGRLAAGMLGDVRDRGLAVDPQCRFIRGHMGKHPQYLDLVPPALRSAYDM